MECSGATSSGGPNQTTGGREYRRKSSSEMVGSGPTTSARKVRCASGATRLGRGGGGVGAGGTARMGEDGGGGSAKGAAEGAVGGVLAGGGTRSATKSGA